MQFQSIIAVLSFALVATSVPTTPSTSTTTVCKGDNTASYCTEKKSGDLLGSLFGVVGTVVSVLPILNNIKVSDILTCTTVLPILNGNQQVANACCPNSGVENGLVNIGTVCVPINV